MGHNVGPWHGLWCRPECGSLLCCVLDKNLVLSGPGVPQGNTGAGNGSIWLSARIPFTQEPWDPMEETQGPQANVCLSLIRMEHSQHMFLLVGLCYLWSNTSVTDKFRLLMLPGPDSD